MNAKLEDRPLRWMNVGEFLRFITWVFSLLLLGAAIAFLQALTEPVIVVSFEQTTEYKKLAKPDELVRTLYLGNTRINQDSLSKKLLTIAEQDRFSVRFFENELYTWGLNGIKQKVSWHFLFLTLTMTSSPNVKIEDHAIQVVFPVELDLFFKKIQVYCSFKLKHYPHHNNDLRFSEFFFGGARIPFIHYFGVFHSFYLGSTFYQEDWLKALKAIHDRITIVKIQNNQLILER